MSLGWSAELCQTCWHHRTIVSENGYHAICMLTNRAQVKCMTDNASRYEPLPWANKTQAEE